MPIRFTLFDGSEETMTNFEPSQTLEDLLEGDIGSDDDCDPCTEEKYTISPKYRRLER